MRRSLFILVPFLALLTLLVSCLKDIINIPENYPEYLEWDPSLAFPLAEESYGLNTESGFDTSLLALDTITGLPQWVNKIDVVMEGSIEFDLAMFTSRLNELKRVLFRVNFHNGFPNDMHAQVYFYDPGLNPVDSFFSEGPLEVPPGTVLGNGETIEPYLVIQDAIFDHDRLTRLEDASSMMFRAILKNPEVDPNLIPFYPGYRFTVELGVMADLAFDFSY